MRIMSADADVDIHLSRRLHRLAFERPSFSAIQHEHKLPLASPGRSHASIASYDGSPRHARCSNMLAQSSEYRPRLEHRPPLAPQQLPHHTRWDTLESHRDTAHHIDGKTMCTVADLSDAALSKT